MVTSLIRPSFGTFARGNLSKRPNLWKDLVGCWNPSLGITGMTLRDVSGYDNHGTLTNMNINNWVIDGDGYHIEYDGSNDFVDCGNISSAIFSADFTVVMDLFVDIGSVPTNFIAGKASGGSDGFEFLIRNTELIEIQLDGAIIASDTGVVSARTWFKAIVIRKGNDINFYIDLTNVGSGSNSNNGSGTANFNIGQVTYAPGSITWTGFIGKTLVYERGLSEPEIWDINQYPNAMFEFADRGIGRAPLVEGGGAVLRSPKDRFINNLITR